MNLQTFLQVLTVALYNETAVSGFNRFRIRDVVEKYSLNWKIIWADNIVQELARRNFARVYWIEGDPLDYLFSIAAGGVDWVEQHLGENVSGYLEQHGANYKGETTDPTEHPIDSALWTGRPNKFVLEAAKRVQLVQMLDRAERDLELLGASNSEKAMARAYIVAARTLAESPEPPEDMIWELIARANSLAGVASLFVSIIALFVSAGK